MTAARTAVLLDTHVLVWLVGGDTRLSARARRHIAAATTVWVSAMASSRLPGELHGDPADRIIAATTRHLGARLVTADEKLLAYGAAGLLSAVSAVQIRLAMAVRVERGRSQV